MIWYVFLVFGLVIGLNPGPARAEQLMIATGEFPPYADSTTPDGGLVNGVIAAAATRVGIQATFLYMPWKRAIEATRAGRYDATSFWYYSEDRTADFIHVGPVSVERIVFLHRTDSPPPEWETLSDLAGLRIGAVPGYTYTPEFWELAAAGTLTVIEGPTDEANVRKLHAGRIDLYPHGEIAAQYLIDRIFTPQDAAQLMMTEGALTTVQGYLLVGRHLPDAAELAARLQTAIDDIVGAAMPAQLAEITQ